MVSSSRPHTLPLNILSLCSGIGGLDLGVSSALRELGGEPRAVCYVEREAFSAACLVAAMERGALDEAPVWTDLETLPIASLRGAVDFLIGGFPCQPVSCAGKRLAQDDERWLWTVFERLIRDVGPRFIFLENVPGLLVRGLGDVLGSLAGLGFDAEWCLFSAAQVGAPHRRERWFCLAYRDSEGLGRDQARGPRDRSEPPRDDARGRDARMGEPMREGWQGDFPGAPKRWSRSVGAGGEMADSQGVGERESHDEAAAKPSGWEAWEMPCGRSGCLADAQGVGFGQGRAELEGWERVTSSDLGGESLPDPDGDEGGQQQGRRRRPRRARAPEPRDHRFPPRPGDADGWRRWLDNGGRPPAQPRFRRGAHGVSTRVDRLRALGNAVVPAQAEAAFLALWRRAFGG